MDVCKINHGVTFQLTEKIDVNGKNTHPVFEYLKKELPGSFGNRIKWNFTKFLIAPDGKPFKRFAPTTKPSSIEKDIVQMIKFHNSLHGEKMISLYENQNFIVFRRGNKGIVAINKSEENQYARFSTFGLKKEGKYIDLLHNHSFQIKTDSFELFIPPRTAQMWLNSEE